MGLSDIFKLKPQAQEQQQQPSISVANDNIRDGETYVQFGTRICGVVNANINSLSIYLSKVFLYEKEKFLKDEQYQKQQKASLLQDLEKKNTELNLKKNQSESNAEEIKRHSESIAQYRRDIDKISGDIKGVNREAKLKFNIGAIILLILTVYLFIFYSSTFYSAFFKDFVSGNTGIGAAMFDAKALVLAFGDGLGEAIFICTAPIIFMALGYSLHYFNSQTGKVKYVKVSACVLITFFFDCILAFLIGKNLYSVEVASSLETMPEYTISMALGDPNIWAVIFCGFVTYMIWGIVLDMTLSAYADLKCNKSEISILEQNIKDCEEKIERLREQQKEIDDEIIKLNGDVSALQNNIANHKFWPATQVKMAITDFYAGWMLLVNLLAPGNYPYNEAKSIVDEFVNKMENENNK